MRSLNIVSQYFIPNVFDILGLFSGGKQVFKLDVWAVDEFHLESKCIFVFFFELVFILLDSFRTRKSIELATVGCPPLPPGSPHRPCPDPFMDLGLY